jgi:hypothetical protein
LGELVEVFLDMAGVGRPLARRRDEDGAFDRIANLELCLFGSSSAARDSGARPSRVNGTTRSPSGVATVSWPLSV